MAIQLEWNIVLDNAGMSGEKIYQYDIERPCEQYAWFNGLTAYSYDDLNPDKLMMPVHYAMYLFERYVEQCNGSTPYGKWYVERLVSRGGGAGTDYTWERRRTRTMMLDLLFQHRKGVDLTCVNSGV